MRSPSSTVNGRLPVVDQDDTDVAAVVRVDGARAVEDRHPVLVREAASGANLRFKSTRQGKCSPVGIRARSPWLKHDGGVEFGPEVEACAVGRAVGGQGVGRVRHHGHHHAFGCHRVAHVPGN